MQTADEMTVADALCGLCAWMDALRSGEYVVDANALMKFAEMLEAVTAKACDEDATANQSRVTKLLEREAAFADRQTMDDYRAIVADAKRAPVQEKDCFGFAKAGEVRAVPCADVIRFPVAFRTPPEAGDDDVGQALETLHHILTDERGGAA